MASGAGHDAAILAPRLVALPPGTTRRFARELGVLTGQAKFPRIIDERRRALLEGLGAPRP